MNTFSSPRGYGCQVEKVISMEKLVAPVLNRSDSRSKNVVILQLPQSHFPYGSVR